MAAFANAKTLAPKKPASKKPSQDKITVPGIRQYAMACSVLKTAEAIKTSLNDTLKQAVREIFIARCADGNTANFKGIEENAEGSIQLRKRSGASPLTAEEMELLDANEIPYEKEETVVGTFVINPEYLEDEKLMEKAAKALSKAGLPEDFIMAQESRFKYVVTDETIQTIHKKGLVASLIDTCFTLSVSAKVPENDADLQNTVNIVTKALTPKKKAAK